MRTKKKNYKAEVRTMKARYWYYKGSDIIGEGRADKKEEEDKSEGERGLF